MVFVETAQAAARALQEQLTRLGGQAKGRGWMEMGAARYLRTVATPFDLVFLDPPFGQGALAEYVPLLDAGRMAAPGLTGVLGK